MSHKWVFIAVICEAIIFSAQGRDLFELESQRNADGSFDYRLRTLPDPFFTEITLHQIAPFPFTNYVDSTPPDHWTNFFGAEWAGIMFDHAVSQPRTNEITFTARSSATHFKRQKFGMIVSAYFEFAANYENLGGIGGYVTLDCLVPCSSEEADGSPPNLTSRREVIRDIKIDALVRTNNAVHGVTFSWAEPLTVEVEGSHDLKDWNHIARFFGDPPQTTWTTNSSLNSYGKFFRLAFVANSHVTNTAVLQAPLLRDETANVPIKNFRIVGGQLVAEFVSKVNKAYQVDLCRYQGSSLETFQLLATNNLTRVSFDIRGRTGAGLIRIKQLGN